MRKSWLRKALRILFVFHNWPLRQFSRVGDYEIQEFLGSGGYALAYLATHTSNPQKVLLKQLRYEVLFLEPNATYEADLLKNIALPGVPHLYDVIKLKGKVFLVLEYFEGNTVADLLIEDNIQISEAAVLEKMYSIMELVVSFHHAGIVHLDLRIPNILFYEDGVRVIDWGLSEKISDNPIRRRQQLELELYHLGHFAVYLLYSTFEKTTIFQRENPWYEELQISQTFKDWIFRMMGETNPFHSSEESLQQLKIIIDQNAEEKNGTI